MKKLSEKDYWDTIYEGITADTVPAQGTWVSRIRARLKHLSRDYSNYVLAEILYPMYLPKNSAYKIVEVGCAPGKYLVHFHDVFGYEPFGVEYSEEGCAITRANFSAAGLNPDNVTHADFFDPEFLAANEGMFNVVFSRGFIEHFDDVKMVVDEHIRIAAPGGYLVIMIPNLRGLNYYLLKMLNVHSLLTHNFSIMDKRAFQSVFDSNKVDVLYCDYVGTFSFGLMNTNARWKYILHRILLIAQRPFDFVWRSLFGPHHIRCAYTSPYLLCIARLKRAEE